METRVLNTELKTQIEEFVIEQLENCELFVNTYGNGYAAQRLALNFKELYTDELSKKANGEYQLGTSGRITLFMKGSNGNLLTFDDLIKEKALATALHECIHAIFNKTPQECKDLNISCGSGIHERYGGSELGRGLNEGFTNWVCNKAGLSTMSYASLTDLVNILEIAIGPEKIMKLGNGNIAKNIPELLGMSINDCQTFLGKTDAIYNYEDKNREFSNIALIIKKKIEFEAKKLNSPELVMDEDLSKSLQELENNSIYENILNSSDYIEYTQKNNLEPELESSKLKYCEYKRDDFSNKAEEIKQEIQGEIISKHFIDEIVEAIDSGDCSFEKYTKFSKLSNLININKDYQSETLQDYKAAFKDLRKRIFYNMQQDIKDSLKNGTLTAEKLNKYRNLIVESYYSDHADFNSMLSKIMLPENTFAYEWLFNSLSGQNKITEIFDYRLFELQNSNGQKIDLYFDTQNGIHFTRFITKPKIIYAGSEIKDKESLFNITLNELQPIQEVVNNFLKLKDKINQTNPNTCLQIVDDVIISTIDGGPPTFYVLNGTEWEEAIVTEFIPQNVSKTQTTSLQLETIDTSNVSERENNSLAEVERNPFKRFLQGIKRRFFKSEMNSDAADGQTPQTTDKLEEDRNNFTHNLSHTEDGKPIETPTIVQNERKTLEGTQNKQNRDFTD